VGVNLGDDTKYLLKKIIFYDPTLNYYLKGDKNLFKKIPYHKSLFYTPKDRGLPIGNLTSQFFANIYLNEVDQYIKRTLKVRYYIRYVDDMVLLSNDKETLLKWRKNINDFLKQKLRLELHSDKDKLSMVCDGIDFLGYVVRPNYTLSRRRVVGNIKTKIYFFNQGYLLCSNNQKQVAIPLSEIHSEEEIKKMLSIINSYYGHFKHANCYDLRKNLYDNHFGILKEYLEPSKDNSYFKNAK